MDSKSSYILETGNHTHKNSNNLHPPFKEFRGIRNLLKQAPLTIENLPSRVNHVRVRVHKLSSFLSKISPYTN